MCRNVYLRGTGAYVPSRVVDNEQLAARLGVEADWIARRTGILERRVAAPDQATSDLACEAAFRALENARLTADEIDLILVATLSPDQPMPSTACIAQAKLGIKGCPAFDVGAACTGFLVGLSVARQFVVAGSATNILVIGAEVASRVTNPEDRTTAALFGDGAGAAIISSEPGRFRLGEVTLGSDGSQAELIQIPAGGSRSPASPETVRNGEHFMRLCGKEVYRFGSRRFAELVEAEIEHHQLQQSGIGKIITHQSNARMIEAAATKAELPSALFWQNVDRYGNTCAASVPISLHEYLAETPEPDGAVILAAVGAGLMWGGATLLPETATS